jgi:quercetin dioxygenase-like cupin family protein
MNSLVNITRAAVLVAGLAGAALITAPARATPPSGFVPTLITNGDFGTLNVQQMNSTPEWGIMIKSRADTDVRAFQLDIADGGYSGWHTHPGPSLLHVLYGTLVDHEGEYATCPTVTYHAGDTIVESGGTHNLTNVSGAAARIIAIGFFPHNAPTLTSVPEPNNCAF